jgi:hypothetical protein
MRFYRWRKFEIREGSAVRLRGDGAFLGFCEASAGAEDFTSDDS